MKKAILGSLILAGNLFGGAVFASSTTTYTTNAQDTYWKIAQKYNVNVNDLMKANPTVKASNMYEGLTIQIPARPASDSGSWQTKADAIIATGKTQLGTPYVFGGDTPNVALDCSGFVQYAFNSHGYNLPHSAALISKMGVSVSKDQLRKGDLVFLSGTYKAGVSHVGIYLGNNQMLQASSSGCVKISSLFGNPYYNAHYWGAKRLIN
ncbi:LysM peptidoglycan-binding domain-containing C40 family peptidase [Aneurinibacillus sp. Ricciae_BoGa-3]|uniref:C40 family peptidase n=1 Tax=Aneurinibacillus sp. Ricciae_BoGa-3 TaxID=3022697 RepID=UPI0023408DCF|nr:LysM peptidoglycan-binding domain-containing C40 family peptidase [Aneurinibacillus sp. Ricciae_BoGa-3]WCK54233.1 LysM peptidoglycan-binding domain-containing C40 family peptidase [Aneurinibacillus sp. Ricciae_BoGa-3]